MIAELAEPRIGSNVTRPFPRTRGWVWERDYIYLYLATHSMFTLDANLVFTFLLKLVSLNKTWPVLMQH